MKIFYFTATGNSLYVAQRIGSEIYSIPQLMKEENVIFKDEAIGFVLPCYAFGIPRIVVDFLNHCTFKASYFFGILTYGNMAGAGLRQLEMIGEKNGISFDYTNEILMVDNYLPIFKMEEQLAKEASKEIELHLEAIVTDIHKRRKCRLNKGIVMGAISKLVHLHYSQKHTTRDSEFVVTDQCNQCGICATVCPQGNISIEGKPIFHHNCESCFACLHHCPQGALHMSGERSMQRFRNQHISLADIIAANK